VIFLVFCAVKYLTTLRKWVTEVKMGKTGEFYGGRKLGQAGEVELDEVRVWEK